MERDVQTTILIPWDGQNEQWLDDCLHSFPVGTPFVVVQNDGKHEMAAALNAVLDDIETPYTFVCGADDLAGPGMLELLEDAIGDADGVYPRMELFGERTSTFEPPLFNRYMLEWRNTCGVFLIRTEVLKAVGGWRNAIIEDWELINRVAKAGFRMERVLEAEYRYRQHSASMTHRIESAAQSEGLTQAVQMREILGDSLQRTKLEAVFRPSATPGVAYVRGLVPAEHLPGVVSQLLQAENFECDTSIFMHPGLAALHLLEDDATGRIKIADVDDAYCADQLIPEQRWQGRIDVANQWEVEQPAHNEFVRRCAAVFASTPHLAEVYSEFNKNVYTLRNGVLEWDWRRVRKPGEDGKIRIGWAAGSQHKPDSQLIGESLRRVKLRHPDVEVCLVAGFDPVGWDFDYVKIPHTKSLAAYRSLLATFDISLGPIRDHVMGRGKSDLKWLEASMAGAAFIGSDLEPYRTVKHGRTGLLAKTMNEWETAIETLVKDEDYRARLVRAARKHVVTHRNGRKVAYQYRRALADVRAKQRGLVAA